MPIYKATFRSGTQQYFEMDTDDSFELIRAWEKLDVWESDERANISGMPVKPPPRIFTTETGAGVNLADLTGFQRFISPSYAMRMSE